MPSHACVDTHNGPWNRPRVGHGLRRVRGPGIVAGARSTIAPRSSAASAISRRSPSRTIGVPIDRPKAHPDRRAIAGHPGNRGSPPEQHFVAGRDHCEVTVRRDDARGEELAPRVATRIVRARSRHDARPRTPRQRARHPAADEEPRADPRGRRITARRRCPRAGHRVPAIHARPVARAVAENVRSVDSAPDQHLGAGPDRRVRTTPGRRPVDGKR